MARRSSPAYYYWVLAAAVVIAALRWPSSSRGLVELGQPAPDFTVAGISGSSVRLSSYRGKLVLVNFWASWCPDCREEFPTLERAYRLHRREGFEIVAPSVDDEGRKAVMPFIAQAAPSFTICLADRKTEHQYSVRALPASFLVGPDGRLIKAYIGAVQPGELENDIVEHLPRRNS